VRYGPVGNGEAVKVGCAGQVGGLGQAVTVRRSRLGEAAASGEVGRARHGGRGTAGLGTVRLGGNARLGRVRLGGQGLVCSIKVRMDTVRRSRLGRLWSGTARRVRAVTVRRGTARRSMVRRSGLGWARLGWRGSVWQGGHGYAWHGEAGLGGLGEVCCVRATLGLSGRSWCVLACCGNARQQRECGGRGNSPLCGQGGLGGVCFCASGCGSFGLGEAVKVRSGRVGSGEAVVVRYGAAGRGESWRSRCGWVWLGAVWCGKASHGGQGWA
jgi:hypothetical protein